MGNSKGFNHLTLFSSCVQENKYFWKRLCLYVGHSNSMQMKHAINFELILKLQERKKIPTTISGQIKQSIVVEV